MSLLAIAGLRVTARIGGLRATLFRDLDLALPAGGTLGVVGEAGAGKSVLARSIAVLPPPGFRIAAGRIGFDGQDLRVLPPSARRRLLGHEIAFLPPDPRAALAPDRTVAELLDEHHARLGVDGRGALRTYALAALQAVLLADPATVLRCRPADLDAATCLRVLMAIAFAGRPRLVVADAPTAALDLPAQAEALALLQALCRRDGSALLLLTRDIRLAAAHCAALAVLYAGEVVETGPAAAIVAAPAHPYTASLMLALPRLTGPRSGLRALSDHMPGLRGLARLEGCRFAPRCPVAVDYCRRSTPALTGAAHRAACLRPGLAATIVAEPPLPAPPVVPGRPVLELDALTHAWPPVAAGGPAVPALHGVSLRIAPGEFVGLVGAGGSGKSTLLRLVAGLARPAGGRILHDGQPRTGDPPRPAEVQMVFAEAGTALNPSRPAGATIAAALAARGAPPAERERRVRTLLAELDLPLELGLLPPDRLGDSQRLRIALARALGPDPALLVADEWLDGMDPTLQARMLGLLPRLRRSMRFALLFASRDLAAVRHLCDRVVVLDQGRIAEEGPVDTVFGWPRSAATRALVAAVPAG